ncbi:conserved exported hypothetical protein [Hyella patelloides LEGE 07179]|uniref:Calcium-binding protein n=1 Tax=Hyella patelloides LEGE 07179 TaxID=945734 RepID=A0A563W2X6_9CYAN|nr:calcium-binding protein [Hyella patelloides]VEP17893.1 conserved exported hypothetical protein [Hyella patelloides LEGE 07179]
MKLFPRSILTALFTSVILSSQAQAVTLTSREQVDRAVDWFTGLFDNSKQVVTEPDVPFLTMENCAALPFPFGEITENETDFWEILNKNLVTSLLSEPIPTPFGIEYNLDEVLDSITVDLDVQSGSSGIETPRSTMAVATPQLEALALEETFSFQLLDYEIEHQGEAVIDLAVDLDLKDGIGTEDPLEYPDFVPIRDYITDFLVNYENETDFWEILNKNLVTSLISEPIPTPFGIEYNLDEVLDSITVDLDIQSGSSGIETPRSSRVVQTVERSEPLPEEIETVFGSAEADFFDAAIPDDKEFVGNNQILFTGSGDDTVDITFAPGGKLSRVDLGSGDDTLFGGSNHRIIAGSGSDLLFLGSGEGNNIITGGTGDSDQFWLVTDTLDLPSQENTITDFVSTEDVIGFANTTLGFDQLNLIQDGSNTIINALGQDLAILLDTQVTDLNASDFVFT